ncbi:kinase-like domain-containing protein [Rhizophagus irregularis DAOM 181602=DAOM 197198]|nr:kinase-like domain-containing protein [Rhizophagus irregularis DAOM 181602=DAOM 197198]
MRDTTSQDDIICKSCGKICTDITDKWCRPSIWKDGLLEYNREERKRKRTPNKEVTLKYLINSQNVINEFSNEAKAYSIKEYNHIPKIYGISQNPATNNYIIVLENSCCKECGEIYMEIWSKWCRPCQINNLELNHSGNKKIDEFIQEMQLKIESVRDIIVEWIPYDQFNIIKEISKDNFARIYLAIWKVGPLECNYDEEKCKHKRKPNKEVTLKCLNNSQNVISDLLNEAKTYSIKDSFEKYKYERQPNKEVILKYSNNSQSAINDFLNEAKAYSIKGKYHICDIPKIYGISQNPNTKLKRTTPNKEVALKCLHNSQNITNEFLNEINAYSISIDNGILRICGISQNPDTNNYIIVLEYANGGNLDNYNNNIIRNYNWVGKLSLLRDIVKGLKKIHENE